MNTVDIHTHLSETKPMKVPNYKVRYASPNHPLDFKSKDFTTLEDAEAWIELFKYNYGNNWRLELVVS